MDNPKNNHLKKTQITVHQMMMNMTTTKMTTKTTFLIHKIMTMMRTIQTTKIIFLANNNKREKVMNKMTNN